GYIDSYEKWAAGKHFLLAPKRLYDDELMITGLVDAIYKDGENLVLVDYKTPARESKTWAMQASAYSFMCKKNGYNISRIEFVKLDKTGKEPKIYAYMEDMQMFNKVLECYRYFFTDKNEEIELDYI
ncbi:PD-(D/E)XK nuclease family protein, partial [Mangrovimonas sp. AS39]|uniref:PD-(D/E)XK nuclease family protein n=1 Tax=Mangrovimonas futianensis TaxID=2895523 RepID=UPI001E314FB9